MPTKQGVVSAKQARSRQTHQRLVSSCIELLDEKPFDRVTIAEIAQGAGVSVGNFYRRFTRKEAILPDLYTEYDRRFEGFASTISQAGDTQPTLRDVVTALVSAIADFMAQNRGLVQALHLQARLHPEIIPLRSHGDRHTLFDQLKALLPDADPERSSRVGRTVGLLLVSTLIEQIVYPEHTPAVAAALPTEEVVAELVDVIVRYVEGAQ
ncbi:MAG: TetR family transcriptional regulator [Longimicrobiales bacterium]